MKYLKKILRFVFRKYIIYKNYLEYSSDIKSIDKFESFNNKIILISQLQKSGGHLLLSLLDGHSRIHVYPHELILNQPQSLWFDEKKLIFKNQSNYSLKLVNSKHATDLITNDKSNNIKNFFFSLAKQEKIFKKYKKKNNFKNNFILYFFSFFNSWINYHKKFNNDPIVFFIPQFFANEISSKKLYENFKNFSLVYICRDPLTWSRSAKNYKPNKFKNLSDLLNFYIAHQKFLLKNFKKKDIVVISYENLIKKSKLEIQKLLKKLGLNIGKINLSFTSNNQSISTYSSFKQKKYNRLTSTNNLKYKLSKSEINKNKKLIQEAYKYYYKILNLNKKKK